MRPERLRWVTGCLVAILATSIVVGLRLLLAPVLADKAPSLMFTLSVMVAGWWGGLWPGLLATALGVAAVTYFFLPPVWSFAVADPRFQVNAVIFLVVGGGISWLCETLHRQRAAVAAVQEMGRLGDELRMMVEQVRSYAIFMTDLEGRATSWNHGVREVFGYDEHEFLGRPVIPLIFASEDVREGRARLEFERAAAAGAALDDRWMIKKDKSPFFASGITSGVRDRGGKLIGFVKIVRDQTEQKQLTDAVRTSEERLRKLVEANIVGVVFLDRQGRCTDSNEEFLRIVGHGRDDLGAGRVRSDVITPEEYRRLDVRGAAEAEERGSCTPYEKEFVRKDGVRVPIVIGYALLEGEGDRYIAFVLDISRRKRLETSLRLLADAGADLIEVVDLDSTLHKLVALVVPAFADWCAVDLRGGDGPPRRAALIHADPSVVRVGWELAERYPARRGDSLGVGHVLDTGRAELVEDVTDAQLVAIARDEHHLQLLRRLRLRSYIGVPLRVKGEVHGVMSFATAESGRRLDAADLSVTVDLARRTATAIENARLYRSLQEADRRKDEFLAVLAHELRNPLAPIRNAVHVLRMTGTPSPELQWARDVIDRQLAQMVRLVDDLMDISRITRNKLELRKERVELDRILKGAVETSRPLIDAVGHALLVSVPPDPILLDADLTRLAQVFSNLLNNAAKYTRRGGTIWLVAEVVGDTVVVTIRDTGVGIEKEMLTSIFDMFTQVNRSQDRSQGGLGIGLTLVRRLVEMHEGTVEARSEGTDQGSEFVVRLPIVPTPAAGLPVDAIEGPSGGHHRIVVADDNRDSAESLAMLLTILGHEVRTAGDGLEAVTLVEATRPDLVLLDIGMPKMNGYEAARHIRQAPWGQKVVLVAVTGWGQQEDRRRSQEAGFDHHMVKPLDLGALQALLAAMPR